MFLARSSTDEERLKRMKAALALQLLTARNHAVRQRSSSYFIYTTHMHACINKQTHTTHNRSEEARVNDSIRTWLSHAHEGDYLYACSACVYVHVHTHSLTDSLTDSKRQRGLAKAAMRYQFDDLGTDNGVTNGTSFFSHPPSLPVPAPSARALSLSHSLPCPSRPLSPTPPLSLCSHTPFR